MSSELAWLPCLFWMVRRRAEGERQTAAPFWNTQRLSRGRPLLCFYFWQSSLTRKLGVGVLYATFPAIR